ncbi:Trm112 family protein [Aliidiomarina quisquiliarum]|uniref:Trm112 family protein n=1 Tax=Aliidiomarina quisquiliarum TaxID=2938947 RepID=UPI002111A55A|nr:Trm112 family protein [Aliidiomarina quisquiliarum]
MSIPANLLSVLACPSCKGKLVWGPDKTTLVCRGEQLAYPVRDGIPAMLAQEAKTLSAEEMKQVDTL